MKLKDRASFFSFFLEEPLYEVCLIWIKEQIDEKRSTVCTHRYADCLLKNTSTKHSKYVFNKKNSSMLMISVSENLFGRIRVFFLQDKICPFLAQSICIYVGHSFLWNTVGPIPVICPSRIRRVYNSNVLLLLQEERDLDCMIFRVLQNPHLIHTIPRVASVTVTP